MSRWPTQIAQERFWAKVDKTGECWLWTAAKVDGYGVFGVRGEIPSRWRAHRLAYTWLVGPIPAGLDLDHLCRTPACVNPAHLEAVTHAENCRRGRGFAGQNAQKTHCKHGHEFTVANTRVDSSTGWRDCRACDLDRYYAKGRAQRRERMAA